ncbi:MAG: glycosyltransferase family 4 protein [Candidatus Helarchaeota archaeon]
MQCYLISKYLAEMGHEVFYIALDNVKKKNEYEIDDGFTVIRLNNKEKFQFFLIKYKPAICYIREFNYLNWLVKRIKKKKIPIAFGISHVLNTMPLSERYEQYLLPKNILKTSYRNFVHFKNYLAVKKTDKVISLSYELSERLKKLNISNEVINNSAEYIGMNSKKFPRISVIWVANIKAIKRPELFIKLAHKFSNKKVDFLMIGEIRELKYVKYIKTAENELDNFHYLGFRPVRETIELITKSTLLVHTCQVEGFPNNFIQAWMVGVPTVTLSFDPDGVIEKNKIGYHSRTFDNFVINVDMILGNEDLRKEMSRNARKYFLENHDIEKNIKKYEKLFKELVQKKQH